MTTIPFEELLGKPLKKIEQLKGGINNPTYKLTSIDEEAYILQIEGEKNPEKVFRQPKIVDFLTSRTDIPLAKVVCADNSCTKFLKPFIISEYIQGTTLQKAKDNYDINKIQTTYKDIGHILNQLHSIRFDTFGELKFNDKGINISPSYVSAKEQIIAEYSSWINAGKKSPFKNYVSQLHLWLNKNAEIFEDDIQPCLTHNDFRDANILVSDTGSIKGIVDLDNVASGMAIADIYRIYHNFSEDELDLALNTFFKEYTQPLPKNFERQLKFFETTHVLVYFDCWEQIVSNYTAKNLEQMTDKMNYDIQKLLATKI